MLVRLQKYLAQAQVASRRKAEEIILQGRVEVNGEVVDTLGTKVDDENDVVKVDGKVVSENKQHIYIMLNKPEGCVTTAKDQFERKTVMDYVDIDERVYPVGRLDYDTSGLLLLTNDGDMTYKLTHPKHNVDKTYIATVENMPTEADLNRFRSGLIIDGYKTAKAKIAVVKNTGKYISLKISIHEGHNRQVRKMCDAIGCPVKFLKRIAVGDLKIGSLEKGKYRLLTEDEISYLQKI